MMHHRPWKYREQPPVDQARMQQPTCERCGQRLIWVVSAKNPDKLIPCQPTWEYGDGKKSLVVLDEQMRGHMLVKPGPEVRGRQPHFGKNCTPPVPPEKQPLNPHLYLIKGGLKDD